MTNVVNRLLNDYMEQNGENDLLHYNDQVLTHKELEITSNEFANYLIEQGVQKGDRVAIMMDLNIDTIIAVMGIIKSGGIYVPIDTGQTEEFIQYVLKDTDPKFIIVASKWYEKIPKGYEERIHRSSEILSACIICSPHLPAVQLIGKDIVYITYTSGTTGVPKGVMISHQNIMTFMNYVVKTFKHGQKVKSLCRTPVSFDPFLTEVLPSVISGGQIYIQSRDVGINKFLKFISSNRISNFGCGPSMLFLLADNLEVVQKYDLSGLLEVYIGYEKCSVSVLKTLQKHLPWVTFINGYGTTETFASSTFYTIPDLNQKHMENIPIGDAIEDEQIIIINDELKEAQVNEIGEIIIRGNSLFNGYWHNEEQTDLRLRLNPLLPESNEKVYFTGDLAVKDEKGQVYFVGRKDEQVKIRGYRVELGEIEHVIVSTDQVKECCVVYEDNQLICYYNLYTPEEGIQEKLQKICKTKLAAYKVPSKWILVERFPRNANGKILKKALKNL